MCEWIYLYDEIPQIVGTWDLPETSSDKMVFKYNFKHNAYATYKWGPLRFSPNISLEQIDKVSLVILI